MKIDEMLGLIKENAGAHAYSCFLPSLDREVSFRGMNVAEMKTISKMALDQESDGFYVALVALIATLCNDTEIQVKNLNELDRLIAILTIKQNNVIGDEKYKITCSDEECKTEFIHCLNIDKMITDLSYVPKDKFKEFNNNDIEYKFKIGLPSIGLSCKYRDFINKLKKFMSSKEGVTEDDLLKADIYFLKYSKLLFIREIYINGDMVEDFNDSIEIEVRNSVIDALPVGVLVEVEDAILDEPEYDITDKLGQTVKCPKCKNEETYGLDVEDFFQF